MTTNPFGDTPIGEQTNPFGDAPVDKKFISPKDVTPEMGLTQTGPEQYTEVEAVDPWSKKDYAMSVAEPAGTIASAIVTDPIKGFGALRTLLYTGDLQKAANVIESAEKLYTYEPKTEAGKAGLKALGETIQPVSKPVSEGLKYIGDLAYEQGGPNMAAAYMTTIAALPELIGMKGTRAAKKAALSRRLGKDSKYLYDEAGNIAEELKAGLDEVGINIEDVKDILPDAPKIQEVAKETAQEIGEAAVSRKERKALQIAEEVQPDIDILNAADELGITELLPSHYSQNPVYTALEQGLKSIPGSQLAATEKRVVSGIAQKADDFIKEFGGDIDKALVADNFKTQALKIVGDLEGQADKLYNSIRKNILSDTSVKANNTTKRILDRAKELGGEKFLDPVEKKIYAQLRPSAKPTYARLDNIRKEIGRALNKNSGPFKDGNEAALKQIYKGLAEDQLGFASNMGWGDTYKAANSLVVQRKGIEDKLTKILGRELSGTVTPKAKQAILGLQKGETKAFDELVNNIPKELDKGTRRSVFVSALNDAFTQGSRKEKSLNIAGFDDFMAGISRNKESISRLQKEIGKDAVNRLETIHKVSSGIRGAQAEAITTGRIASVPKLFDEVETIASKVYGLAQKIPVAGRVSAGLKGAAQGTIEGVMNLKKTPRSVSADEFLASPRFQKIIKESSSGILDTPDKMRRINKAIENMKEFKALKKTMSHGELSDIATVGILGYLTGETIRNK